MAQRDEFDDEGFFASLLNRKGKTQMPRGVRRLFILGALGLLSVILIAVAVSAWPSRHHAAEDGSVPIVRADTDAYKVKPTEPGGMDVPNKDSTIFETLKGKSEANSKTENLLEDSADTKASDAARATVAAKVEPTKTEPLVDLKLEKTGAPPDENLETSAPPQPVAPSPVKAVAKTDTAPIAAADVKPPVVEKTASEKPAPEKASAVIADLKSDNVTPAEKAALAKPAKPKSVAKAATPGGATYIQLASVKSESDVARQWSAARNKNPELAALTLKTQKADLGEKGIYYRIQAGPLTADDAARTCAAVKSRGGSCIVAK